MAKRSELINQESMDGLLLHHPYILLFQKNDWKEYLELIALIYDYLEETNAPVPFDVLKTILYHHYSDKVASTDAKITNFFTMMIAELQILKDSHDQWGKRFIESTPHGKELLKLVESMLVQRTRFSGTSAETMLGALNGLLLSTQNMSQGDAEKHHREKIKAYQADLEKIIKNGPKAAELLPLTHSYEALFGQAEEAAIHVLAATEDVKVAIERERKKLAERYIKQEKSAGENIRILADFHLELHQTEEYKSYKQAKELFSQLNAQVRFKYNDVNRLLGVLLEKDVVSDDALKRSHLSRFPNQFEAADASIREKIKVQIEILRQQVNHALMTDTHLVQNSLNNISTYISKTDSNKINPIIVSNIIDEFPAAIEIKEAFPGYVPIKPIFIALEKQHPALMQVLISKGVDINATNWKSTVLHEIANLNPSPAYLQIFEMFLQAGARTDLLDHMKMTVRDLAIKNKRNDLIDLLNRYSHEVKAQLVLIIRSYDDGQHAALRRAADNFGSWKTLDLKEVTSER